MVVSWILSLVLIVRAARTLDDEVCLRSAVPVADGVCFVTESLKSLQKRSRANSHR